MKEVEIGQANPGMVLASSTQDLMGNLLFAEGTELTAANLRILKAWGVRSLQIQVTTTEAVTPMGESSSPSSEPMATRTPERTTQRKTRRLTRRLTPPEKKEKKATAPQTANHRREELVYRFAHCVENPLMQKIRSIAEKQLDASSLPSHS
ncbi:MAG: hypothetical protein ACYTGH_05825 [Planctomycetota bacterium]